MPLPPEGFVLTPSEWALAAGAAFLIGLAKTGVAGIGTLGIVIFANVLPPRESTGVVLPMLVAGDIIAVAAYRRHADWGHLVRLFPWAVAGIIGGYAAMDHLRGDVIQRLMGITILLMVALQLYRQGKARGGETPPPPHWTAPFTGLVAGFTTMVANAAGPVILLYLLAMRLPKMSFVGTGAWYFFLLNVFKLPFSWDLGLIHPGSLRLNAILLPCVVAGAFGGKALLPRLNQRLFESLALAFTALGGFRLLF